jgi:hypothetical protein
MTSQPLALLRWWRLRAWRPNWIMLRILLVLGLAVVLFFPSFFGDDGYNDMPPTEVSTVTSFLQEAAPGPVYCAIDNAPLADTSRYNLFPLIEIFGSTTGPIGGAPVTPDIANMVAKAALSYTGGRTPAYVIVTPSMLAYSLAYGVATSGNFKILLAALAHSPKWKLLADRAGTVIYELPPTARH